jgi:hypothetical protein
LSRFSSCFSGSITSAAADFWYKSATGLGSESERLEADCVARVREKDHSSRGANSRCTNLIETDDDALELIRGEISAATFEQWEKIWFMFMSRTAIEYFQGKPDLGLR